MGSNAQPETVYVLPESVPSSTAAVGLGSTTGGLAPTTRTPPAYPEVTPKPLAIVRHSQYRPAATPTVFHTVVFVPAWTWTPEATVTPLQPLRSVSATMVAVPPAWYAALCQATGKVPVVAKSDRSDPRTGNGIDAPPERWRDGEVRAMGPDRISLRISVSTRFRDR